MSVIHSGIPQGQAFQRVGTVIQPKHGNNTAISWIHGSASYHDENYVNLKPPGLYK